MSKNILGALCMVVSVTFFSLMDILVKVTDDYAVGQILFFRALFGFIPIIFLIPMVIAILLHSKHGTNVLYKIASLLPASMPKIAQCIIALDSAWLQTHRSSEARDSIFPSILSWHLLHPPSNQFLIPGGVPL